MVQIIKEFRFVKEIILKGHTNDIELIKFSEDG